MKIKGSNSEQLAFAVRQMMRQEIHWRLQDRWNAMRRIEECKTIRGTVHIVESGMDCDGVQYSGAYIGEIDASWFALVKEYNRRNEDAEGPFSLVVVSPVELDEVEYRSRDLAMEAFENGHPHVLYRH